jgi:hypothetical protein
MYAYMKNINLSHKGVRNIYTPTWYEIYKLLELHKHFMLIQGIYNEQSRIEINKFVTEFNENPNRPADVTFFLLILAFIICSNVKFMGYKSIYTLLKVMWKQFIRNTDMYEMSIQNEDLRIIFSNIDLSATFSELDTEVASELKVDYQIFVNDFKSRI